MIESSLAPALAERTVPPSVPEATSARVMRGVALYWERRHEIVPKPSGGLGPFGLEAGPEEQGQPGLGALWVLGPPEDPEAMPPPLCGHHRTSKGPLGDCCGVAGLRAYAYQAYRKGCAKIARVGGSPWCPLTFRSIFSHTQSCVQ